MDQTKEKKFAVFFQLDPNDAELFLRFKRNSNIKSTAEAARKLMLDQLRAMKEPRARKESKAA